MNGDPSALFQYSKVMENSQSGSREELLDDFRKQVRQIPALTATKWLDDLT
jgi:hypothetical protein